MGETNVSGHTSWSEFQRRTSNSETDAKVKELLKERRNAQALADRLAAIEAHGTDVYADGTVVAFDRTIGSNTYTYAAVKAAGFWYVTGAGPNRMEWDDFVLWLTQDGAPTSGWTVLRDAKAMPVLEGSVAEVADDVEA
jgi:hypothetical protein